ncbi:unnamed protein product [Boreogadus saida]
MHPRSIDRTCPLLPPFCPDHSHNRMLSHTLGRCNSSMGTERFARSFSSAEPLASLRFPEHLRFSEDSVLEEEPGSHHATLHGYGTGGRGYWCSGPPGPARHRSP